MPRPKKDFTSLNMKVDSEVMKRFNSYCEEAGQTKTLAFERIVTAFLNQYDKDKEIVMGMNEIGSRQIVAGCNNEASIKKSM